MVGIVITIVIYKMHDKSRMDLKTADMNCYNSQNTVYET